MEQACLPQIRPQCGRDRVAQQLEIGVELSGVAGTWDDGGDRRMGQRKLQSCRGERHPVGIANAGNRGDPLDNRGWGRAVVPGIAAGEDAGIQLPANDDRGAGGEAFGEQVVERGLFQ
jgi:hypothetical protein